MTGWTLPQVPVRSIVRDLLLVRAEGRRMRDAVVYLVLIAIAVMPAYREALRVAPNLPNDGHAIASLSLAVNRAFCGARSALTNRTHVGYELHKEPRRLHQPIADFITESYGSIDRYCATVTIPFVNNENSLMLAESWALTVAPRLSLAGVGRVLLAARIVMLLAFTLALLRGGANVLLAAVVLQIGFAILQALQILFAYSVYSFLFALVAMGIGVYLLAFEISNRAAARVIVGLGGGLFSAFAVNMRTSYLPIFALLFAIYLWASDREGSAHPRSRRLAIAVAACVAFAIGYGTFQYTFISRLRPSRNPGPSYHIIAHPLVLALAVPPNALSQREGIAWDDAVGVVLARRIDPHVQYKTPEYESALSTYYLGLWSRYPREMCQIYIDKLNLAGRHMIETAKFESATLTTVLGALRVIPDGAWLFGLLVIAAAGSAWSVARRRRAVDLAPCMLASAAMLLMIECAAVMPFFYLSYGNTLVFACGALAACAAQFAIGGIVQGAEALFARRDRLVSLSIGSIGRRLPLKGMLLFVGIVAIAAVAVRRAPAYRPLHVFGERLPEHTSQTLDLIDPTTVWTQRAGIVTLTENRMIAVDGQAESKYSYLLVSAPRPLAADTYVVATGVVTRGGLTVGVQQAEKWVTQATATAPGRFRIAIKIPADGPYQVVLANCVNDENLLNTVKVTSLTVVR